ncbi:hypothetical protein R3P38DRAFT_2892933, partial [Favolaschia claudopus]
FLIVFCFDVARHACLLALPFLSLYLVVSLSLFTQLQSSFRAILLLLYITTLPFLFPSLPLLTP